MKIKLLILPLVAIVVVREESGDASAGRSAIRFRYGEGDGRSGRFRLEDVARHHL